MEAKNQEPGIDLTFLEIVNRNSLLRDKLTELLMEYLKGLEEEYNYVIRKNSPPAVKPEEKRQSKPEGKSKDKYEGQPNNKYDGYDKSKDLIDKLIFILSRNKAKMSFKEVMDSFLNLEPELKYRWSNIPKSISHILSKACSYGVVMRSKLYGEHGPFRYSIPEK